MGQTNRHRPKMVCNKMTNANDEIISLVVSTGATAACEAFTAFKLHTVPRNTGAAAVHRRMRIGPTCRQQYYQSL